MKKYFIIAAIILIAVVGVIYSQNKNQNAELKNQTASLQVNWIPAASFTGEVVGAQKFDQEHNLDLQIEFGGPGINPTALVQSGQSQFGYMAADEVFSANEKGADFVIIALASNDTPAGYVSLESSNIKTLKDLEGKKVGVYPFGNTTLTYEVMLAKNNIDRNKIDEVSIAGDLKPFISRVYDVQPVFVYDETIELDKQGLKYNTILPKDYGINLKGNVYFTTRKTLEENPELVESFVKTLADGWNYALENKTEAMNIFKTYVPELDSDRELLALSRAESYFTAYNDQPLNSDVESWNETIKILTDAKFLTKPVDLNNVLKFEYINQYYQ